MTTDILLNDGIEGLKQNWKQDVLSGFLVFLIALPLCLGISLASGFPPISGIFTAVIGGILVTFIGSANVAIKGPAVGLIVIAVGAVTELGAGSTDPMTGYKLALATIVISGILQTLLGILRAGSLSDFFPTSAVHGMLAAIGIIIAAKQIHVAMGVKAIGKGPLDLIAEIPHSVVHMNPEIAIIGLVSLVILFSLPLVKNKYIRMIPAPMLVVIIAIPLGFYFDLEHAHKYLFLDGQEYELGPKFLVTLPENLAEGIQLPDWSMMGSWITWKYIIMFTLVGSLESVLSSKAIDVLDPFKRKTKMNKDLIGVGIGNTLCGMIGALPMISEMVRSSANINSGGRTKWSNFFHGCFLLLFVALVPGLIHQIPLAALAAMLIFTGYRLASPKIFKETLNVGEGQLFVFISTIIVTLLTDLIIGIVAGIAMELLLQLINGAKIKYLFSSHVAVSSKDKNEHTLAVNGVLTFSNYLGLKKKLDQFTTKDRLQLDLSHVEYVDHTVMEHLHHLGEDYHREGGELKVVGAEKLKPMSSHPLADRVLNRNAVVIERSTREDQLRSLASQLGFAYKDFHKIISSNFGKLSNEHKIIKYEGNILSKQIGDLKYVVSDLSIVSGGDFKAGVSNLTVLSVSNLHFGAPLFTMKEEKFFDNAFLSDINFTDHPKFSKTYKLNGFSEAQVREFFTKNLITYFEGQDIYHIESLGSEFIIYKHAKVASPEEIKLMFDFAKGLVDVISKK